MAQTENRYALTEDHYSHVAIALHWTIAALILFNLVTGLVHDDVSKATRAWMMPLHFSAGLSVLLLTLVRIGWRLGHKPPPFHPQVGRVERLLAQTTYGLFYALMILMPLGGWAIVSAHPPHPGPALMLWGIIPWPAIGPLAAITPVAAQKHAHEIFEDGHGIGGWIMLGLLGLHIAGALKHQLLDKVPELRRMLPGN